MPTRAFFGGAKSNSHFMKISWSYFSYLRPNMGLYRGEEDNYQVSAPTDKRRCSRSRPSFVPRRAAAGLSRSVAATLLLPRPRRCCCCGVCPESHAALEEQAHARGRAACSRPSFLYRRAAAGVSRTRPRGAWSLVFRSRATPIGVLYHRPTLVAAVSLLSHTTSLLHRTYNYTTSTTMLSGRLICFFLLPDFPFSARRNLLLRSGKRIQRAVLRKSAQ